MSGALFVSTRSTRRSSHELRVTIFASSRSPGGSLPMLYAATAPDVHGGDYIGPDAFAELWAIR
jgi:hypothetical protein